MSQNTQYLVVSEVLTDVDTSILIPLVKPRLMAKANSNDQGKLAVRLGGGTVEQLGQSV